MSLRFVSTSPLFTASFCCAVTVVRAAEPGEPKRTYNLPRGDAATTLRQFADVSGRQVFFMMDKVQGEQTNAVSGEFSPSEALDRMLAGTALVASQSEATNGFVVGRHRPPDSVQREEVGVEANTQPQSKKMKSPKLTPLMLALFGWLGATSAPAQTAPTDPSRPAAEKKTDEEKIILSPFVVSSSGNNTYTAVDTLAGNRTRTSLADVGSSIQVATGKFLSDTNSKNAEDLLVLMTSMEVGGQSGNFLGQGNGPTLTGAPSMVPTTRVRGLDSADTTQDFFLTRIPFDTYNVGRIDIQRGPNSILFGIGKPGGIINATVNDATFHNSAKLENQIASFGSVRTTFDFNRVLLPDELAIKVSLLDDETKYREEPAFRTSRRVAGALHWEPKFLNGGSAHTSFKLKTENGKTEGNAPLATPPIDRITPYFSDSRFRKPDGTLRTFTALEINDLIATNPWLDHEQSFYRNITAYEPGGAQGMSYYGVGFHWPDTTLNNNNDPVPSVQYSGGYATIAPYDAYANIAKLPGSAIGAYKAKSLSDPSIFDFYNKLLYGPNSGEWQKFQTITADLSQTFLNNQVGLDLAYRRESSRFTANFFNAGPWDAISVDIINTLPDGRPNPNAGRPMTAALNSGNGQWSDDKRETLRLTGFGELDFRKIAGAESWIGKVLGRNVFTGLVDRYSVDSDVRTFPTRFITADPNNWQYGIRSAISNFAETYITYLGQPVGNRSSASGLNLTPITGELAFQPTTQRLWNNVLKAFVQAPLSVTDNFAEPDDSRSYFSATKTRDVINSKVITWQGYFFDGALVPMFGYRTDKDELKRATAPIMAGTIWTNMRNDAYNLSSAPTFTSTGNSKTYSVVAHLPDSVRNHLPGRFNISPFFNQSENFQPSAGRIDLQGNKLASPTGKTREYGLTISALNDKLLLKITRYKSTVKDVTINDNKGSTPVAAAIISYLWGQNAYLADVFPTVANAASYNVSQRTVLGTSSSGGALYFKPTGAGPYSQAQIDEAYTHQQAVLAAWKADAQLPALTQTLFGLADYNDPAKNASKFSIDPGLVVTGDSESKGTEFELSANPLPGLILSANLTHTDAKITNLAGSMLDFMAKAKTLFDGLAGDMPLFGPANADSTARSYFYQNAMPRINLYLASENSYSSELRPWHFNGTADYTFKTGRLKGAHVGGSYRWADKIVVGYPVILVDGQEHFDPKHPYYGSATDAVDLWVGWQKRISSSLVWRTQLNVRNVFAKDKLEVVTVEPDGSPAGLRIAEPRVISWTNTLEF